MTQIFDTGIEMSFWRNFWHWLHRKLSFRQLSPQPKMSSIWPQFRFSCESVEWLKDVLQSVFYVGRAVRHEIWRDDVFCCNHTSQRYPLEKTFINSRRGRDRIAFTGLPICESNEVINKRNLSPHNAARRKLITAGQMRTAGEWQSFVLRRPVLRRWCSVCQGTLNLAVLSYGHTV